MAQTRPSEEERGEDATPGADSFSDLASVDGSGDTRCCAASVRAAWAMLSALEPAAAQRFDL